MKDLFGEVHNRYYFHSDEWDFCVLVETVGSEFDAIAQTTGVLPADAAPYKNPKPGKRIITLKEYEAQQ